MHPNPAFHTASDGENLRFARSVAFGVLSINGTDGPFLSHIPFLLSEYGAFADLHLVRSNPMVRHLAEPQSARLAVSGPDGYVSPDWYGIPDQVPTWNYVAVHLKGRLERMPQDTLPDLLERQSEFFERRLDPKPRWTMDKLSDEAAARLMRMIVPFRFHVEAVDGTWKLGQNKPEHARLSAAGQVNDPELADLMRSGQAPADG